MKGRIIIFVLLLIISGFVTTGSYATVLPVPAVPQRQTNWCWAASTEAVVRYFNGTVNQCDLANTLRIDNNFGVDNCCSYAYRTLAGTQATCNRTNTLLPEAGWSDATSQLLNNRGIATQVGLERSLSVNEVTDEIFSGRPLIMRWVWTAGGGHQLVVNGITAPTGDTMIYYMNPGPDNGNLQVQRYNWVVGIADPNHPLPAVDHTWNRTLRMNQAKVPIPDIKVNGADGTYYTNSSQYLNVTASLNSRDYTDRADWWVLLYYNSQYYYRDQYGNWILCPQDQYGNWIPTPFWRTPLQNLSNYSIYSGSLPAGTYTLYFGVDISEDGILNNPLFYDTVTIVVQ